VRAVRYFVEEALASIWRARRANVLTVATIAAAIFVLGVVVAVTSNLRTLAGRWGEGAEFSVFLEDEITAAERDAVAAALDASPAVSGREFVSKTDALARFGRDFPDLAAAARSLSGNPFPASFEVRLTASRSADRDVSALATTLAGAAGVADVRFDRQWLQKLQGLVRLVSWAGGLLALVLVAASALTISNVVRLALHARRDEIEIMQLVGTPIGFIRGPFVVEGIVQGAAGALVALAALWIALVVARARFGATVASITGPGLLDPLSFWATALVFIGGMALGCVGGYLASRSVRWDAASR
jgi:cell division transport system permease protein